MSEDVPRGHPLNGKQRRFLRALAHGRKPVVHIGLKGGSAALVQQIDEQLEIHELIKVKLGQGAPLSAQEAADAIAPAVRAHVVQVLGRTLVLYRARGKAPAIRLP